MDNLKAKNKKDILCKKIIKRVQVCCRGGVARGVWSVVSLILAKWTRALPSNALSCLQKYSRPANPPPALTTHNNICRVERTKIQGQVSMTLTNPLPKINHSGDESRTDYACPVPARFHKWVIVRWGFLPPLGCCLLSVLLFPPALPLSGTSSAAPPEAPPPPPAGAPPPTES